jgi:methylated-DNA-[protein]-cysteine S-methyltransferase
MNKIKHSKINNNMNNNYSGAENELFSFTLKVHNIIANIPYGKIMTYKDIAIIMKTKAYRAIGNACNKSPGMPQCPCHRVVSSDFRLHGFASGINNKKDLLEIEGLKLKKVMHNNKTDYIIIDPKKHHFYNYNNTSLLNP